MMPASASSFPTELLEAFHKLSLALNTPRRLMDQLEHIARSASLFTNSDHADITLFDPLLRRFIPQRSTHVFLHHGEDDAAAWIRDAKRALVVPDLNYAASDSDLALYNRDIASYLGVPIMHGTTVEGALIVFNRNPRGYDRGERSALEALAALAAVAINQQRLTTDLEDSRRTLLKLSLTDPATGVATRQQFEQMLEREWRRAISEGLAISLLQVEIDSFERFADEHSRLEAQRILARAAQALHASLYRAGDLIARYSDSRLTVLLPETDLSGATAIARRLRRDVSAAASGSNGAAVTLSVGLSSFDTLRLQRGLVVTPQQLFEAAGRALERAQAGGGNQVYALETG